MKLKTVLLCRALVKSIRVPNRGWDQTSNTPALKQKVRLWTKYWYNWEVQNVCVCMYVCMYVYRKPITLAYTAYCNMITTYKTTKSPSKIHTTPTLLPFMKLFQLYKIGIVLDDNGVAVVRGSQSRKGQRIINGGRPVAVGRLK